MFIIKLQLHHQTAYIPYYKEKHEIFTRCFIVILMKILSVLLTSQYSRSKTHIFCDVSLHVDLHSRAIQVLFFVYVVQNSLVLGHEEITKIQKNVIEQSGSLSWKQSITVSKSSKCHRILILNLPGIAWHLWMNQFDITQSGIDFIWNCYRIFFNLEYKSSATGDRILRIVIIILTLSTLSTMSFHGSPYYQWVCLI